MVNYHIVEEFMGKRKTIMFSMIIIFILIGMGFSYVHHIQKVKAAEQKKRKNIMIN